MKALPPTRVDSILQRNPLLKFPEPVLHKAAKARPPAMPLQRAVQRAPSPSFALTKLRPPLCPGRAEARRGTGPCRRAPANRRRKRRV